MLRNDRKINSRQTKKFKSYLYEFSSFCPGCFKVFPIEQMTLDHIIPRSLGGSNAITNLRLMCRDCNEERGNNLAWKVSEACRPRW